MDDTEVINFLLSTEIIPLCLRTMETGSELSKTVATFIVQKILLDNVRWALGHALALAQDAVRPGGGTGALHHARFKPARCLCPHPVPPRRRWASATSAPPRSASLQWARCSAAW